MGGDADVAFATQGAPTALLVPDTCDIPSHFGSHNIIINLTFCAYTPIYILLYVPYADF